MKKIVLVCCLLSLSFCMVGCGSSSASKKPAPTLTLIGHSTVKIKTSDGKVIYIDPAYEKTEGAYDEPADLILVTHNHDDHNRVSKVTQNEGCTVIRQTDAFPNHEAYQTFTIGDITVEAVPAENGNHPLWYSVGYVISFDGYTVYHAGDTSTIDATTELLSSRTIDYALYPIDGVYNMNASEAATYADSIGAIHNIPMHIDGVTATYNQEKAETFTPEGALYVPYGTTITLEK